MSACATSDPPVRSDEPGQQPGASTGPEAPGGDEAWLCDTTMRFEGTSCSLNSDSLGVLTVVGVRDTVSWTHIDSGHQVMLINVSSTADSLLRGCAVIEDGAAVAIDRARIVKDDGSHRWIEARISDGRVIKAVI